MSATATIRAAVSVRGIVAPFSCIGASTLRAPARTVVVAEPDSRSYRPMISARPQVGGGARRRGVRSAREPRPTPHALVLAGRPGRRAGDRGDGAGARRRRLGRAGVALVRPRGDSDPGLAAPRAP